MISDELDKIQKRLHDSGAIWAPAELLRWWNDGYRQFLALSKAVSRFWLIDVPGGFTFSLCQDWEQAYTTGSHNRFTVAVQGSHNAATYVWETEFIEGIAPTNSNQCVTQPWERAHSGEWDGYCRFALPKDHEQIRRIAWDEKRLDPITTKELDNMTSGWNREDGEPIVFSAGLGNIKTFEIFTIRTDLIQAWHLEEDEYGGVPRRFSGRTYSVSGLIGNAYTYSSSGDTEAITGPNIEFDPTESYTNPCDKLNTSTVRPWQFTFPGVDAGSQYTTQSDMNSTHPWAVDSSITSEDMYGINTFEYGFAVALKDHADTKPALTGLGWRFTKAAASTANGFGTHIWEKEIQDGGTTFSASTTISTFAWEIEYGGTRDLFPIGTIRGASSPDRQYLPIYLGANSQRLLGTPREWRSSTQAISILQTILPANSLAETDLPDLLPSQMFKYIRFYTWSRAFGRQGEGYNPILAGHYERRFKDGAKKFNHLSVLTQRDVVYAREPTGIVSRRPPRPKLPAEFPRVDV